MIDEYVKDIKKKRINISYTTDVIKFIAEKGFNDKFGARPLRRAIQKYIEDPISDMILKSEVLPFQTIVVNLENEQLTFIAK